MSYGGLRVCLLKKIRLLKARALGLPLLSTFLIASIIRTGIPALAANATSAGADETLLYDGPGPVPVVSDLAGGGVAAGADAALVVDPALLELLETLDTAGADVVDVTAAPAEAT
jgi:hypothetical protein